ncbi:MAG: hypothetical protein KVP17_001605 [Porospora cf. gigantea B]|uniref:uncharacterized protein n=1 Tax=Porospora cf. gigantea B TaxID=2853592 RepID=UPI003571DAB2|nr:MAG: hypothetical protein KVP17_001605 [Porospora cf. gigantea B]
MLLKCETRSFRVKGLAFHPQHPWVLVSLHNGAIQLWDYHLGALFDKFEGHEGPVRGVDFHGSQPIFASGGDDFKVIVWSYRTRQMQFALLGHLDYIRTVQFHHESPWLLSASDDQTVRIWNWQNRNCISILAGHNHYVMCAQFHPSQDILLTASLDQTVRVWDIEGLREKHDSRAGNSGAPVDLFGTSDAICRFVIEDHDRGVNWACFHPTLPLIASASDDRVVRLWRYSGAKWWNVWSFRGHFNNVSCVAFHPTKELLISNSEDKTIRIWDINKRTMLHSYRREHDRFWVLAVKPNSDVVAVGHDTGMVVFKLERERVPHAIPAHDTRLFVVKDEWLTIRDIHSQLEQQIVQITKPYTQCITSCQINPYNGPNSGTTLLYFISDIQVLVTHQPTGEDSGPTYHDIVVSNNAGGFQQMFKTYRSEALAAAFLNRQRLAMLTSSTTLSVVSTVLEAVKRVEISLPVSKIFPAGSGRLLLLEEDDATMHLFDVATARCLSSISAPYGGVKEVKWALDGVHFGAMSRHHVILGSVVGDTVKVLGTHHETLRIKSICFDETSTCLYFCTLDHVKYLLEGDLTGILQAVKDAAVYMLRVEQGFLHAISRDAPIFAKQLVGTVEPQLKAALREKRFDKVALFIRNGRLCGNSLVAHLKQSGHADVALMFVEDCTTKFHLALEIGNLKVAEACAIELDEKSFWHKLGLDALTLGNFEMAEASFQKARSFNDLMLMYVMSGHTEKLGRLQQLFKKLDDPLGVFTASLLNSRCT